MAQMLELEDENFVLANMLAEFQTFADRLWHQLRVSRETQRQFKANYEAWIPVRERTIRQLDSIIETMESARQGTNVAHVIGSSVAVVGGVLTVICGALASEEKPRRGRMKTHSSSSSTLQQAGQVCSTLGSATNAIADLYSQLSNTTSRANAKEAINNDQEATRALMESFDLSTSTRSENVLEVLENIQQYITCNRLVESGFEAARMIYGFVTECAEAFMVNGIDWNIVTKLANALENAGEQADGLVQFTLRNIPSTVYAIQNAMQLCSGLTVRNGSQPGVSSLAVAEPQKLPVGGSRAIRLGAITIASNAMNLVSTCTALSRETQSPAEEELRQCRDKLKKEMALYKAFYDELQ